MTVFCNSAYQDDEQEYKTMAEINEVALRVILPTKVEISEVALRSVLPTKTMTETPRQRQRSKLR